jgi:multidrug resistance efflux pump
VHGMLKYVDGQIKTTDRSAQRRFAALQSKVTLRPHFECRITRIHVRPGESVKKGDPLAEVFSTELAAHKKEYRTKKVRWEHDRTHLQSRQWLVESETVSEQLLSEAQNHESRSLFEFQIAEGKLKVLGLDDEVIRRVEKGRRRPAFSTDSPITDRWDRTGGGRGDRQCL